MVLLQMQLNLLQILDTNNYAEIQNIKLKYSFNYI